MQTENLELVAREPGEVLTWIDAMSASDKAEISRDWLVRVRAAAYAFASGRVRIVRAHTLPEPNASTRVLTKCGFEQVGEVVDPDDGLVWRWERPTFRHDW